MQLKEKPELNQINQESEASVKTYQLYRPIKERKSVAKTDRTNLQPIKEPKSVARVDRANLQPIKEPKSVARVDRQDLQPIKEPKSVATTEWPDLPPLKKRKYVVTTVDIQPKEKLDLNQINQKLEVFVKNYRQDLQPIKERKSVATTDRQNLQPIKEPQSVATTLLKIILIYFPLGILRILFSKFSVVSIIITILSAIALPSFMFCGTQTRPARARQYIDSMNRAQQAKYAENGTFSNSLNALGFVIETETANSRNHKYSISATKNAAFSYAVNNDGTNYVGAVFLVPISPASNNEMTTVSILCAAANYARKAQAPTQPPNPILQNGVPVCAAGTKSEAHQYVSLMNGSQEFHFQSRGGFSYFFSHLIPGSNQTINYNYSVSATENAAFSYGVSHSNYFRSYVGAVFLVPVSSAANNKKTLVPVSRVANKENTTVSIMCVANSPGNIKPANPILQNDVPVCAAGSNEVPK
jgi:Tfp pilus assembly protein PilE